MSLNMEMSLKGAAFIRLQEGFVDHFYYDSVQVGTIGIGFTFQSKAFQAWWLANKGAMRFGPGAKMTRAEADAALIAINREEYGKAVNRGMSGSRLNPFPQHVFDGVLSPVYNFGPGAVNWEWAQYIKIGELEKGALRLQQHNTAKGKRLAGLVRRRKEEALLLTKGIYTGVDNLRAPALVLPKDAMSDGILERGEAGPAVAKLIRDLTVLGYYKGSQDDMFGYGTEAAVIAYQRTQNLKDDGVAGPKTLSAIAQDIR